MILDSSFRKDFDEIHMAGSSPSAPLASVSNFALTDKVLQSGPVYGSLHLHSFAATHFPFLGLVQLFGQVI